jgi:hypothetical protein
LLLGGAELAYPNDQIYQQQRHPEQIYDETECSDDCVLVSEPTPSSTIPLTLNAGACTASPLRSSRRADGATMEARSDAGP